MRKGQAQKVFSTGSAAAHAHHEHSTTMRKVFAALFPFESPAYNSSEHKLGRTIVLVLTRDTSLGDILHLFVSRQTPSLI